MRKNVIIDCDPGIDDALALMLALSSPEFRVLGITITCGNAPAEMGFANAKKILKHMNRLDIPIYIGARKPLKKAFVDALDTHGADGLGESFLDEVEGYHQKMDAVSFLSQTLRNYTCTVIAIGPLSNLAKLIEQDPDAFARIDTLISMGGNDRSYGNCSPVAEYNYWADPHGAAMVYRQMEALGKQIHMVGLDVTRQIVLTPNLLAYMERLDPKQGAFIRRITKYYFDFHWEWEHLIGCVINDPLAVAYCLNQDLCNGFPAYVQIETDGISQGQSVVDSHRFYRREANAFVLHRVDVLGFFTLFFERLFNRSADQLDLLAQLIPNTCIERRDRQ